MTCLNEILGIVVSQADVEASLASLLQKYQSDEYAFRMYEIAAGYQFLTKPAYHSSVQVLLKQKSKKRLSVAALETLAIVAYKQPVTKHAIELIRGVSCDYALQKLLDKELIVVKGKTEGVGKPILYGTSARFMEYLGINHLKELPLPKDFAPGDNEIGTMVE